MSSNENKMFTIDDQCLSSENNLTLLVSFSNGQMKRCISDEVKFNLYENKETTERLARKRPRRILVAETNRISYSGNNFGSNAPRITNLCQYHIGVYNKKTNKMRLYPSQLFNLNPIVETEEPKEEEEKEISYRQKVDQLTKTFGSKIKKAQLETRLQQCIENEDLVYVASKAVEESQNTSSSVENPTIQDDSFNGIIPPQNKLAVVPREVYNLKDIISDDEYKALESEATVFVDVSKEDIIKWQNESLYGAYILNRLKILPNDKELRMHKAKLLMYFHYMLQIIVLKAKELRKKDPLPLVPQFFKERLLNKFSCKSTTSTGRIERSISYKIKDKLVAHILVLALFINGFEVNLNEIQPELKVPAIRLTTLTGALGCKITTHKDQITKIVTKLANLSIPLFVPTAKPPRKKRF